jgi:hypothetical protein
MLFKRDKSEQTIELPGIEEYDSFVSPEGYDIVILPFYTKTEKLNILIKDNYNIVKGGNNQEKFIFGYKKPLNLLKINKKHFLCVMTLFYSETNRELDIFFNYYRNQGVDFFYMYYNGSLNNRNNLPKYSDVIYLEWNFYYWLQINQHKKVHHAQIPAMIHFEKKYLPYTEYALMIDTDEFLYHHNNTIKNYLINSNNNKKHLFTMHNWANIDFLNGNVLFLKANKNRGKSIINTKNYFIDDQPSVHRRQNSIDCDINLFHNKTKIELETRLGSIDNFCNKTINDLKLL